MATDRVSESSKGANQPLPGDATEAVSRRLNRNQFISYIVELNKARADAGVFEMKRDSF